MKDHNYLTTRQIYDLAVCKSYPLIRLVREEKISCVNHNGKCYYFLREKENLLPEWLKKNKARKGFTNSLVVDVEFQVEKDLEKDFFSKLDPSLAREELSIEHEKEYLGAEGLRFTRKPYWKNRKEYYQKRGKMLYHQRKNEIIEKVLQEFLGGLF